MGQKGEEVSREKSRGWSMGTSMVLTFTFVRSEALIKVFPGHSQSMHSLGSLFFSPPLRAAWAPASSPSTRKTSNGISGIWVSWRAEKETDRQMGGGVWVYVRVALVQPPLSLPLPQPRWLSPEAWQQGTEIVSHSRFNQ